MRISIIKDTVTPELQRILNEAKRPRTLMQAGAKTIQKEISDHLRRLQERGNKKGWPSQKFFAGKSTSVEKNVGISHVSNTGAVITIADPRFVHRITGGTVKPKRGQYLAIPLTAEAYAKAGKGSIRESMPGLFVVKLKRGLYLVRQVAEAGRAHNRYKRDKAGKVVGTLKTQRKIKRLRIFPLFKLVRSVTHQPHPEELPDVAHLRVRAEAAIVQTAKLLFKAK